MSIGLSDGSLTVSRMWMCMVILVLFSISFQGVESQNTTCPDPVGVANAFIMTTPPYQNGDLVTYQCNSGFTMRGVPSQTCENATWSGSEPSCSLVTNSETVNHSVNFTDLPDTLPQWIIILVVVVVGVIVLLLVVLVLAVTCTLHKATRREGVREIRMLTPRRTKIVSVSPMSESPRPVNPSIVNVVHELQENPGKQAKELKTWMPHSNPVRPINTSTK